MKYLAVVAMPIVSLSGVAFRRALMLVFLFCMSGISLYAAPAPVTYEAELAGYNRNYVKHGGWYLEYYKGGGWIDFSVNITEAAPYYIEFRAAPSSAQSMKLVVDGVTVSSDWRWPKTASLGHYVNRSIAVMLQPGLRNLRFISNWGGAMRVDWLKVSVAPLVVSSVVPAIGHIDGGETVVINGSFFSATGLGVQFNGVPATGVTLVSAGQIRAVTPKMSFAVNTPVTVSVSTINTSGEKANAFTYRAAKKPVLSVPATSADLRPTWVWAPGGHPLKTFRYFLQKGTTAVPAVTSFTVLSNATSFRPAANLLNNTFYTLHLQEKVDASYWTPIVTAQVKIDTTYQPPVLPPVTITDLQTIDTLATMTTVNTATLNTLLGAAGNTSTKALSGNQIDGLLNGLEVIAASTTALSGNQVDQVIAALDNLIVENRALKQPPVTQGQMTNILQILEGINQEAALNRNANMNAYAVMDEMLIQYSTASTTPAIHNANAALLASVAGGVMADLSATVTLGTEARFSGNHLKALSAGVNFPGLSVAPTIGDVAMGTQITIPTATVNESAYVEVVRFGVNPLANPDMSALFANGSATEINLRSMTTLQIIPVAGLTAPVEVSLAVPPGTNTSSEFPGAMYYDTIAGIWEFSGIQDAVWSSDKQWLNFKTTHFTIFVINNSNASLLNVNDIPAQTVLEDQVLTIAVNPNWKPAYGSYNTTYDPQAFANSHSLMTVTQNWNDVLKFLPAANFNGSFGQDVLTAIVSRSNSAQYYVASRINFNVTVLPVNDAPYFAQISNDWSSLEDQQSVQLLLPTAGPNNESGQAMSYSASTNNPGLFSVQPNIDSFGRLWYTPAINATGDAVVTLTVTDNGGTANGGVNSRTHTMNVHILPINDAPTFTLMSSYNGSEDTPVSNLQVATGASAGPADESSQTLTYSIFGNSNPSLFLVQPTINNAGQLSYTPAANANGTTNLTIRLTDSGSTANGGLNSRYSIIQLNIDPVNDAPTISAFAANYNGDEDAEISIPVSATDVETNAGALSFGFTGLPAWLGHQPGNSRLIGTPPLNFNGVVGPITASVSDGTVTVNSAPFTVTILNVNDAPVLAAIPANTDSNEDTEVSISVSATDVDGNTLVFTFPGKPSWLNFEQANNRLIGTPPADFYGAVGPITASVNDGTVTVNSAPFTVTIQPVNDAPSFTLISSDNNLEDFARTGLPYATNISAGPNEGTQTINFVVSNNNNALFSTQPTMTEQGLVSFTPAPNAHGSAILTVTLEDNGGTANGGINSTTKTMTLIISPENDDPVLSSFNGNYNVNEDQEISIPVSASDVDGDTLTLTFPGLPAWLGHQPANNRLIGTPPANFNGVVGPITASVNDGWVTVNSAPFTITVLPVNDAPNFRDLNNWSDDKEDDPGSVALSLFNESDAGAPNESAQTVTGSVSNNSNPGLFSIQPYVQMSSGSAMIHYALAPNAYGSAELSITLTDNGGTANGGVDSRTKSFTYTVQPVNDAPSFNLIASHNSFEDVAQTSIAAVTGISHGPNEDAQTHVFTVTSNDPSLFSVQPSMSVDGMLSYTPDLDISGSATLTVTMQDNGGTANGGVNSTSHTMVVTINPVNDAPIVTMRGAVFNVNEDSENQSDGSYVLPVVEDLRNGPRESNGSGFTSALISNSNPALFAMQPVVYAPGSFNFKLAPNVTGSTTIEFSISDNDGTANGGVDTTVKSFVLNINPVNDTPTISGTPATSILEASGYSFIPTADDVDGSDTLTFSATGLPAWLSINSATGELSGTPAHADVGVTGNIVVSVTDGQASASLPAFSITVISLNEPPVISGTPATSALEDSLYSFTPTASDVDAGDTLTFSATGLPAWLSINTATGEVSGTPGNLDVGTHGPIAISVTDGEASASLAAFSVSVVDTPDGPVFSDDGTGDGSQWFFRTITSNAFTRSAAGLEFSGGGHAAVETAPTSAFSLQGLREPVVYFEMLSGSENGTNINVEISTSANQDDWVTLKTYFDLARIFTHQMVSLADYKNNSTVRIRFRTNSRNASKFRNIFVQDRVLKPAHDMAQPLSVVASDWVADHGWSADETTGELRFVDWSDNAFTYMEYQKTLDLTQLTLPTITFDDKMRFEDEIVGKVLISASGNADTWQEIYSFSSHSPNFNYSEASMAALAGSTKAHLKLEIRSRRSGNSWTLRNARIESEYIEPVYTGPAVIPANSSNWRFGQNYNSNVAEDTVEFTGSTSNSPVATYFKYVFNMTQYTNPVLTFSEYCHIATGAMTGIIQVSTTGLEGSWVDVYTRNTDAQAFDYHEVYLSAYASATSLYLRLLTSSTGGGNNWQLRNLCVQSEFVEPVYTGPALLEASNANWQYGQNYGNNVDLSTVEFTGSTSNLPVATYFKHVFNMTQYTNPVMTFSEYCHIATGTMTGKIQVSTTGLEGSWVDLYTRNTDAQAFDYHEISLSAYASSTGLHLRLLTSSSGSSSWRIRNLSIQSEYVEPVYMGPALIEASGANWQYGINYGNSVDLSTVEFSGSTSNSPVATYFKHVFNMTQYANPVLTFSEFCHIPTGAMTGKIQVSTTGMEGSWEDVYVRNTDAQTFVYHEVSLSVYATATGLHLRLLTNSSGSSNWQIRNLSIQSEYVEPVYTGPELIEASGANWQYGTNFGNSVDLSTVEFFGATSSTPVATYFKYVFDLTQISSPELHFMDYTHIASGSLTGKIQVSPTGLDGTWVDVYVKSFDAQVFSAQVVSLSAYANETGLHMRLLTASSSANKWYINNLTIQSAGSNNHSPAISGIPVTSVQENNFYSFSPTASDEDVGDALTFSATGLPSWLSISPITGVLSGTPLHSDIGTTGSIVISVTDGMATVSLPTFSIVVSGPAKVYAWGANAAGELGLGHNLSQNVPALSSEFGSPVYVAMGIGSRMAVYADGTVKSVGLNYSGRLGLGDLNHRTVPETIPGLTNVKFALFFAEAAAALTNDGKVFTWGDNTNGQLGNGGIGANSLIPVDTGLSDIVKITASSTHILALDSLGRVWGWGLNTSGSLGDTAYTKRLAPVLLFTSYIAIDIAVGQAHSLIVTNDNIVMGMGVNNFGQLGSLVNMTYAVPVEIPGIAGVSSISSGESHALARVSSNGAILSWGRNSNGQCGQGVTSTKASVGYVKNNDGTVLTGIAFSGFYATAHQESNFAIKEIDGSLVSWGFNNAGQLGLGDLANRNSAVGITGVSLVKSVSHQNSSVLVLAN